MNRSYVRVMVVAALAVAATLAGTTEPAVAGGSSHCVMSVIGERADGELVTSQPVCYATFAEAMRAAGVDTNGLAVASPGSLEAAGRLQTATSSVIGIHYDGANWTGASMTVNGSNCSGGWLNVPAAWNDRISSTVNGCPRIRHFWDANLSGPWQDTTGFGGNLSTLDNQTTSIQYLS